MIRRVGRTDAVRVVRHGRRRPSDELDLGTGRAVPVRDLLTYFSEESPEGERAVARRDTGGEEGHGEEAAEQARRASGAVRRRQEYRPRPRRTREGELPGGRARSPPEAKVEGKRGGRQS